MNKVVGTDLEKKQKPVRTSKKIFDTMIDKREFDEDLNYLEGKITKMQEEKQSLENLFEVQNEKIKEHGNSLKELENEINTAFARLEYFDIVEKDLKDLDAKLEKNVGAFTARHVRFKAEIDEEFVDIARSWKKLATNLVILRNIVQQGFGVEVVFEEVAESENSEFTEEDLDSEGEG